MPTGVDRVYLATDELLVTGRRASFWGVSFSLARVTAARVEARTRWVRNGRPRAGAYWVLVAIGWFVICQAGMSGVSYAVAVLGKEGRGTAWTLLAAWPAVCVLGTVLLVLRRRRRPRVPEVWWVVNLATHGREVERLRTRDRDGAEAAAEAVNRAVADRRGRDRG